MTPREYKPGTGLDGLFKSAEGKGRSADDADTQRVRRNVLKLADLLDVPKEDLEELESPGELTGRLYRLAARRAENKDIEGGDASSVDGESDGSGAELRNRS
ncbi:hypothetical protein [Ruegeria sp. HKCCD8929]|uniref:hypothetical protein n=1 Tax=Ruegeria sp. HKCCD8929 TaxID=2683006 RepID=UPI001488C5B9|nr:hypothetical protein [Ruegeria sp. HKCCD8929]